MSILLLPQRHRFEVGQSIVHAPDLTFYVKQRVFHTEAVPNVGSSLEHGCGNHPIGNGIVGKACLEFVERSLEGEADNEDDSVEDTQHMVGTAHVQLDKPPPL